MSNGRGHWVVAVVAILTGAVFAWTSLGEILGARCFWASGGDSAPVDRFLRGWLAEHHGSALENWNVDLQPRSARIDLTTAAGDYHIELALGALCSTAPSARLLPSQRGTDMPTRADLRALAAGFPAPKTQLTAHRAGRWAS